MKNDQCSACYFPYEETLGLPEHGISPNTQREKIPTDFVCPDCGTPKSGFIVWNKE